MIGANWAGLKQFVTDRGLSIQWLQISDTQYYLCAHDGPMSVECLLPFDPTNADTIDFNTNFKSNGNKSPKTKVSTEFEASDKTLKLASGVAATDANGHAEIMFKIPGTPGTSDGRYVDEGILWFDNPDFADVVTVFIVDHDNIMGAGADTVVGSYTDTEMPTAQQGWRIPIKRGHVEVTTLGFYGFIPAGFYLKVIAKRAAGIVTGNMYCNLKWGKIE